MHDVEVIEMKDVVNRNRAAITHPSGHQHDRYDDHQFEIVCVGCGESQGEFNQAVTHDVVMDFASNRWLVIRQAADGRQSFVICDCASEARAKEIQKALQAQRAARD